MGAVDFYCALLRFDSRPRGVEGGHSRWALSEEAWGFECIAP